MITVNTTALAGGRAQKSAFARDSRTLTYGEVVEAWQTDEPFVRLFTAHLAGLPFAAFQWETPPVSRDNLARPFEMVQTDSPGLAAATPDRSAFAEHLSDAEITGALAVRFLNLGGDAMLVAPVGDDMEACCAHLGAFCRDASLDRQLALWRSVGEAVYRQVGSDPLWLSTAGHGIHWLHVRLDSRPKYYRHGPYKTSVGAG